MASKDWKLPDAQHKITEEKGLDIENESIQRQWEKTIVSFIRLEDAFSDIDVYDDTEEGKIPYRQYLMRRWLFIHQDKYKNETLKDEDKKKVNELLKTKHIKEDEYKSLILRNYANPDGASKGDQSKFFGIADNEEELKLFTRAWREALYETCMGEDPIPSDTSHGTYIKMVDVFSGFVHLYSYYYKLNAEGGVEKWIPYEYNLYRNILVTSSSFDKAFNDTYKGFIKPQSEYPDAYTDTFYISQKLSNSTGNSILDVLNDAFSDGSSEWVGYKGGFFSYNDDACVLVTAKGMSFSESGDYSLTYVESGKTTTLTDSRGFEQEADIYYAYNTDEFSEAYENLNTVDNEIADESSLIFEFLIGNENYTDWQ